MKSTNKNIQVQIRLKLFELDFMWKNLRLLEDLVCWIMDKNRIRIIINTIVKYESMNN